MGFEVNGLPNDLVQVVGDNGMPERPNGGRAFDSHDQLLRHHVFEEIPLPRANLSLPDQLLRFSLPLFLISSLVVSEWDFWAPFSLFVTVLWVLTLSDEFLPFLFSSFLLNSVCGSFSHSIQLINRFSPNQNK